jgi:UDP-N-acetylmuramoylalanine--D-glutamate ligase
VLLNITPDHLDRYENLEDYAASKIRLFHMQEYGRTAIYRLIDTLEFGFGLTDNLEIEFIEDIIDFRQKPFLSELQKDWPTLQGMHNLYNLAAAERACETLGLTKDQIHAAFRTYPGLPHRMERVREKDGILFVNDSKATNSTATAPALAAFPRVRWILGGQAKTDNLDECAPHFGHVRSAYTIGEAGELFARLLSPHMPVECCETLENAVNRAAADSQAGDTVLLSPACASFDQFRDFEARGDKFRELVGAL